MLKQFVKDSAIYGASNVITRGISIFLVPFYTRVFTPNDYGIIDLIGIFAAVASSVVTLEITQAIARFYPDTASPRDAQEYASTALYYTLVAFGLFMVTGEILAEPIGRVLLGGQVGADILRVALLGIVINGLFYFTQNQLRWRLEPSRHATCSLVASLTTIGLTIFFVLALRTGVVGVFWAQVLGGFAGFSLGLMFSRGSYISSFSKVKFKEMLRFCAPIVPSSLAIFAFTYADRISITSMMTLSDLGIFGIGYRVASAVTLLMMGFQSAITPLIFSRYKEAETPAEVARIFRYFSFLALVTVYGLAVFGREILIVLTTPAYYGAVVVVPFLVASTLLFGMYVFAPGLWIAKRTKVTALINVVGAGLNALLNVLLIPWLGILGSATATFISSIAIFSTLMYYSQQHYAVPHRFKTLLLGTLLTASFGTAGYFMVLPSLVWTIALKSLLMVFCVAALVGIKLISLNEVRTYAGKLRLRLS